MSALNIEKLANAFLPNAIPSLLIGSAALKAVAHFGSKYGGLWVGGKVTATPDGLHFVPNGMNIAVHAGLESTHIPLANIRTVTREFGWLAGIVVVQHAQGEFRFRCFGAKRVAAILASHVTAPQPFHRRDVPQQASPVSARASCQTLGVTTNMLLADYTSVDHCFEFDPNTGVYSHIKLASPRKDRVGYSGIAQLLRSLGEGKVLVAQYVLSGDAWLSIGSEKWNLFDESISVTHNETWGIFLCELSLHKDGKCIKRFRYLRRDWFLAIIDSTYDQLDFSLANLPVDFVPYESSSVRKQREDFIKLWAGIPAPNQALNSDAPNNDAPVS